MFPMLKVKKQLKKLYVSPVADQVADPPSPVIWDVGYPELDLDYFTCGLLKLIPVSSSNSIVFTGGLLFDAYFAHIHQTKSSYNLQDLKDIDLFLIGSDETKANITKEIITNLKLAYGDENVGASVQYSVISIYIVGIPRIVQLICTNYTKPDEVIDSFDFAHVAMHLTNGGFYVSPFAKMAVQLKKVLPNPNCGKRAKLSRLLKYSTRGLDISDYVKEFPLTTYDASQVEKKSWEKITYDKTKNLVDKEAISGNLSYYGEKKFMDAFIENGIHKELLDINVHNWTNRVNWSGDFRYVQPKENFLHDSNSFDIIKVRKDNEFYGSLVGKKVIYESHNKLIEANETSGNETIFVDFIVKARVKNIIFGPVKIDDYSGSWCYHVILTLTNEEQIDLVKRVVKTGIEDLAIGNDFLEFYETGILDSQALNPEEKKIFNGKNFPYKKYADPKLTKAIDKCTSSHKLCLFTTIYQENFSFDKDKVQIDNIDAMKTTDGESLNRYEKRKLLMDKFLTDKINQYVYVVFQVKNLRKGGVNSVLNQDTRARTSFIVRTIF